MSEPTADDIKTDVDVYQRLDWATALLEATTLIDLSDLYDDDAKCLRDEIRDFLKDA